MKKQWEGRELTFEKPYWSPTTKRKCDLCRAEFSRGDQIIITDDGRIAHPACVAKLPE